MNNLKTKHTPGPWSIMRDRIGVYKEERVGMVNVSRKIFDVTTGLEPQPADARLIAASPDLLAALVELCNQIEVLSADGNPLPNDSLARQAIAKATGGES